MTEFRTFDSLVDAVQEEGDLYWQELAKLEFAKDIWSLMSVKGISKAELAKKLDVSQARVTQCLRGDKNLQIETMVTIARAVGGELHLRVHDRAHKPHFFESMDGGKANRPKFCPPNLKQDHKISIESSDAKTASFA